MKFVITTSTTIITALISLSAFAQQLPSHGPSAAELDAMALHNATVAQEEVLLGPVGHARSDVKAFYEYDHTEYLVMSDDDFGGMATDMKAVIAANLPSTATLLIFTSSTDKAYQQDLMNSYSQHIDAGHLKILQVPVSGDGFWARDGLPIPVYADGQLTLIDNIYYHQYEPDAYYGKLFAAPVIKNNYYYEGGNFMPNSRGDCLVVNRKKAYFGGTSDTAAIPDDVFRTKYGCKNLIRFKHLKGIGHADEVVKFVNDDTVLTDTAEYKPILEKAGFTVIMLPEADLDYETYANSLIVNGTVYVPVFGESNDKAAIDIYTQAGFKAVPVNSRELATGGQGGIHCITMGYPTVTLHEIMNNMNVLNVVDTVTK